MKAQEFVIALASLAPTKEEYISYGFSESLAENLSKEYSFVPSSMPIESNAFWGDEVFKLLGSFDSKGVQIGLVTFMSKGEDTNGFVLFGNVEIDVLAVSKSTLEIVVLDHDDLNWVIWPCAANGSHFLNALLVFAEFLSYKVKNKVLDFTGLEVNECALLCSEKAGGEKYLDFYRMLLGQEE